MHKTISFDYQLFEDDSSLNSSLQQLLKAANDAVNLSYAPYSRFHVGAALLLSNGEIIKGSNQENARNGAETVSFDTILSPCGICRQSLLETTQRQQSDIGVILSSPAGQIIYLERAAHLLPLAFSSLHL